MRFFWAACLAVAFLPAAATAAGTAPTIEDLVNTRGIDGLTLSPDGKHIAFRVIMPSLSRNDVRLQWYSMPSDGRGAARKLGGESAPIWVPNYDMIEDPSVGWAPDSKSIFVRQLRRNQIQVDRLGPGRAVREVTQDQADVVSFDLSSDGRFLHYETRAARAEIDRAIAAEKQTGIRLTAQVNTDGMRITDNFRVGSRVTTLRRTGPSTAGEAFSGELREHRIRVDVDAGPPAKGATRDFLNGSVEGDLKRTIRFRSGVAIALHGLDPDPKSGVTRQQVVATMPDGTVRPCAELFCTGVAGSMLRMVTLNESTGEVVILYEKDYSARSVLYGWRPETGAARTILDVDGSIGRASGWVAGLCPLVDDHLVCVQAGPARPPRLLRVDLASGAATTIFDPNEALAAKSFGSTEALAWTDEDGRPATGVLVLPQNHSGPLPLIISSYRCRGFLRGGMAEVVPEHIATQMGFAAVCVNLFNESTRERDPHGNPIVVAGHKATLKSWKAVVNLLAERGLIDRTRVGAAGHSFSGIGLTYVISHSDLLAAASLSGTTTLDPSSIFIRAPNADSPMRRYAAVMGLPDPNHDPQGLWKQVSPALNADKIRAPVLMQSPESEYLPGLQLHAAIEDAGGIIDTYIYPDEGHLIGRQPVHQYWRNRRSLDWFGFWLQGRENRTPETNWQFDAWRKLRAARETGARPPT